MVLTVPLPYMALILGFDFFLNGFSEKSTRGIVKVM